jgi:hypothetical protein
LPQSSERHRCPWAQAQRCPTPLPLTIRHSYPLPGMSDP